MPWRVMTSLGWLVLKGNEKGQDCIHGECPSEDEGPPSEDEGPVPTLSVGAMEFRMT